VDQGTVVAVSRIYQVIIVIDTDGPEFDNDFDGSLRHAISQIYDKIVAQAECTDPPKDTPDRIKKIRNKAGNVIGEVAARKRRRKV